MSTVPESAHSAIVRYTKFHNFDPKFATPFDSHLAIPKEIGIAGRAIFTTYRSDKWHKGEAEAYIHEHEKGVNVYLPSMRRSRVTVPKKIQAVEALVRLGACLGIAYEDGDGEEMVGLDHAGSELYCTPDGHALLVISDRRRLDAMIWGGKLKVLEQGIVG